MKSKVPIWMQWIVIVFNTDFSLFAPQTVVIFSFIMRNYLFSSASGIWYCFKLLKIGWWVFSIKNIYRPTHRKQRGNSSKDVCAWWIFCIFLCPVSILYKSFKLLQVTTNWFNIVSIMPVFNRIHLHYFSKKWPLLFKWLFEQQQQKKEQKIHIFSWTCAVSYKYR